EKGTFSAIKGRASLIPFLAKKWRSHFCLLVSIFLHHETGELTGTFYRSTLYFYNYVVIAME
ncbi:hypothetical protein, partial [Helicobacter sp. 13S00401-1]|uniref:hypothetical protein n=1 Tax=Helicobacter sp. 13S00401-1 TaxID=1905758 RepID=UPI001C0EFD66